VYKYSDNHNKLRNGCYVASFLNRQCIVTAYPTPVYILASRTIYLRKINLFST